MEITRKTDYAIRLISELIAQDGRPLSVREAALAQGVPYTFARSIQHDLVLTGFVRSLRGAHGGMILAKDPKKLSLLELIEAVQGPMSISVCASSPGWCERERGCKFHAVWETTNGIIRDYLSSVSVKELLEGDAPFLSTTMLKRATFSKAGSRAGAKTGAKSAAGASAKPAAKAGTRAAATKSAKTAKSGAAAQAAGGKTAGTKAAGGKTTSTKASSARAAKR